MHPTDAPRSPPDGVAVSEFAAASISAPEFAAASISAPEFALAMPTAYL
jgi:hypothetical protein